MKSITTYVKVGSACLFGLLFSAGVYGQVNSLPFNEQFNVGYSSDFYSSGGTSNAGSTDACTLGNYVGVFTSSGYLTTKTYSVPQGSGLSISFQLKNGGSLTAPDVYLRVNDATQFNQFNTADNGWVKLGSASTSACGTNTFTAGSDIVGGQKISVTINFSSASATNWISIDNLSLTATTGSTVQTSYTEDFTTDAWYNSSGYVKIPYHSNSSSSNAYAYLFSGGVGGSFDYCVALEPGFDPDPTNIITEEVNTGGYSNGELRFNFRSQYPCGGPNSYTFDENYSDFTTNVYIMEGADNGSNSWTQLPVNYYFPDETWRYATVDISAYRNSNIKIKFANGGFCSNPVEEVDNVKIEDRNCTISGLTCGAITGSTNPSANTNYNYSVAAVTGAAYYFWYVRNGGTLYNASPYIVSGQGTQNVTINFGSLASPLRVICIPYDANPNTNTDACYATLAYTDMVSCTPPVISSADSSEPTTCGGTDGSITLSGLTASTAYSVTYNQNGTPVNAANFTTDGTGALVISGLPAGAYNNFVVSLSGCSSAAFPSSGSITISNPSGSGVTTPVFNLGATSSRCEGAGTVTYTATATNTTGITYSLDATSLTAGNTINSGTGAVTYTSSYTGTAIITASATGCGGPETATHTVTISAATGTPLFNLGSTSSRCQGIGTVTYTATASNSTNIVYSLDATSLLAGNTINSATGAVTWAAAYNGTGIITAAATGCGNPASANHTVTITSSVDTPVFNAGTSALRCEGAGTDTYNAAASNNTGITYSLDATSLSAGNSINPNTGMVTWSASYNGTATVTASAAGCNGPTTASLTVTVSLPTGTPVFSLGNSSSRCQGAGTVIYSATAANSAGISYTLDATSLGAGNTINSSTGAVTYTAAYTGTAVITAVATGCGNPTTGTHIVTINAPVSAPVFNDGSSVSRCQGANTSTYTANANNSTGITYSLDATSLGAGNTINSSTGQVNWSSSYNGTATVTASAAGCGGPTTAQLTIAVTTPVSTPVFSGGTGSTRCQGAGIISYTATADNSTGVTYSLDIPSQAAGNTINSTTGQVTWVAGYSGTATITATASGCGNPAMSTYAVTVTPSVGQPLFTTGSSSSARCSGTATQVSYTASASNSTGISYSLDATSLAAGNTIDTSTGLVNWVAQFSGSATITATAYGCNGPVSNTLTILISSPAGTPVFNLGSTSTRCEGAGSVTYTAAATNSNGILYRLDGTSEAAGNTIDSTTGQVDWQAGYSGTATVTAIAIGCGSPFAAHIVTITPSVDTPVFTMGANSTRCRGAGTVTYSATAVNNTGITYSLDVASLTGGNTINAGTGEVNWSAAFGGTSFITATATGCNGPVSATHTVIITNANVGVPVFAMGATSTRCSGASSGTYTATAANSATVTYYLDATSLAAGNSIDSITGQVNWTAGFTGNATITAVATGCDGPTTATHVVTVSTSVTPSITITASTGNTICAGNAVTLNASITNGGGVPSYQWLKNNNPVGGDTSVYTDNNLNQGDVITCELTSGASCASPASVTSQGITMIVYPTPAAPIASVNSPLCEGDDIQLNCQQVSNASYNWTGPANFTSAQQNPVITNADSANAGQYLVSVTVNRCTSNADTLNVVVKPAPAAPSITQSGDTLTASPANSYQWYFQNSSITGATLEQYVATQPGIYSVQIIGGDGCSATSVQFAVKLTGVNDIGGDSYFDIYPNPVSGTLVLSVSNDLVGADYELYDIDGQMVSKSKICGEKCTVDVSHLAAGVYFVRAGLVIKKMVKE